MHGPPAWLWTNDVLPHFPTARLPLGFSQGVTEPFPMGRKTLKVTLASRVPLSWLKCPWNFLLRFLSSPPLSQSEPWIRIWQSSPPMLPPSPFSPVTYLHDESHLDVCLLQDPNQHTPQASTVKWENENKRELLLGMCWCWHVYLLPWGAYAD